MITNSEKLKYKVFLGHRYTSKIQEVLNDRKEYDVNGKPFKKGMIRQVFNGLTAHSVIENAIIIAVNKEKRAINKLKKMKNKI